MTTKFTPADVTRLRIALGKTVRSLDRRTNSPEITRTELTVLGAIARFKRVPLGELAEYENLNPTMLSRILGKLQDRGLVTRETAGNDRRAAVAVITPEGRKAWEKQRKRRDDLVAELLTVLSEEDVQSLLDALAALEALADASRAPHT
ncbi:MarR family winged helix-turn-helix transcriptional regulator [Mycobacterium sp. C31M]